MLREMRGHKEKTPHHYPSMLYATAWSPDGRHLATGDKVGHVVVWDAATGQSVKSLEAPGMYTWDPVARRHSIGGIRALRGAGVERRVALIGFDDVALADVLDPAISVVAQDPQALGRSAADLLFRRLDGDASPSVHDVVPVKLIARGSGEIGPTGRAA